MRLFEVKPQFYLINSHCHSCPFEIYLLLVTSLQYTYLNSLVLSLIDVDSPVVQVS